MTDHGPAGSRARVDSANPKYAQKSRLLRHIAALPADHVVLDHVPPGDHTLRFSRAGYATAVVTDVRVLLGQLSRVDGVLTAIAETKQGAKVILDK